MALLPSITPAQVEVRIKFSMFFDRAGVAAGISKAKRAGLYKAGSVVMQIARRSIKKMGMARPKLAVQKEFEGASLGQLLTFGDNMVSKATKNKIRQRIFEIKFKPPSQPGTPPHTHLNTLRNAITYAYDPSSESVVVGGFMRGIPQIVSLHEYGGTQQMQAWAWIPAKGRRYSRGIIGWWPVGRRPHLRPERWQEMGSQWVESFDYPARPYMRPALARGIASGRIPRSFGNSVKFTGG